MKIMYDIFMPMLPARPLKSRNKARPVLKGGVDAVREHGSGDLLGDNVGNKSNPGRRLGQYTVKGLPRPLARRGLPRGVATLNTPLAGSAQHAQAAKFFKTGPRLALVADRARARKAVDSEAIRKLVEQEVVRVLSTMAQPESAALRSARERGLAYARAEYEKPEHLSLAQASGRTGQSERVINERRNAGRYYALIMEGNTRGFRFPDWQFSVRSERLAPVLDVMREANASCWTTHHFLSAPNSLLGGMSPRDYLLADDEPIEHLINIARGRFSGEQGAG